MPTPAVAYLTKKLNADASVVISASHNTFEFNGVKYFSNKGMKISDEIEEEIEEVMDSGKIDELTAVNDKIGVSEIRTDLLEEYVYFFRKNFEEELEQLNKENFVVAVDTANGATSVVADKIFNVLGIKHFIINDKPDGININHNCGSTHMEGLKKFVIENKCNLGIAYDGDGDRCLAVDENGNIMDGDVIMAIISNYLKNEGKLKKDTLVATVMSNLGLKKFSKENDIDLKQTKVGDRYVLEEMLKNDYNLGGEQSGHIILLDYIQMKQIDVIRPGSLTDIIGPAGTLKRILKNQDYFNYRGYNVSIFNNDIIVLGEEAQLPQSITSTKPSLSRLTVLKSKLRMLAKSSYLLSRFYLVRNNRRICRLVDAYLKLDRNPDVVVFHSDMECYYYLLHRRNTTAKVVVFYHSDGLPYTMERVYFPKIQNTKLLSTLEARFKTVAYNADKCVFISSNGRDNFLHNYPDFDISKTAVVLNGIDRYTDEEINNINQLKRPIKPRYRLVCTGTINSRKGQRIILEAMSKLPQSLLQNISIDFVGDGPERVELQQFVDNHNLSNNVIFSGSVDNRLVYTHLEKANIYILMSHNEGLPISIIEAMRAGLPIISTKIAGIPELVDERNGVLINPNIEELLNILMRIDEFDWTAMGQGSLSRFENEFTFDRMKKEYCDIIDSLNK